MFWKYPKGTLEVITGPMFAGKSAELIKRLTIWKIAKVEVMVFKPSFDQRFDQYKIVSRTGSNINAIVIKNSSEILPLITKDVKAVAFDEIHFFDQGVIQVIEKLLELDIRVIVSGLDTDYLGQPFEIVADLLARADTVNKLKAVCMKCLGEANMTYRKVASTERHLLGDDEYEARCRTCHAIK
ncbi:thymidine kinase [Mycoplasma sp. NEAQ87857]|uniref:thymidine kinase n=1 Tax=Mycoplasma sp. NEAQ87857 TaxID=2683967 RepID=UPI0013177E4E|nr:thymidine kinase [Mycoplasma sp. NEAQ87857]QGZ97595.1 thymidine kinase [Mycoplasma sp. NEAQ87857]